MPDLITLTGVVATPPRHITTNNGLDITSFRLASSQRRFDRDQKRWVEAETNWYTVTGFRQLAQNMATSIERGQRVVVSGRLRIRAWENNDKSGTTIEVEADAVGHDLSWGTAVWVKSVSTAQSDGGSAEKWTTDALNSVSAAETPAAGAAAPEAGAGVDAQDVDVHGVDAHDAEASRSLADLVPF